jgi:hypothetical protein
MNAAQAKAALKALTVLSLDCPACLAIAGNGCVTPGDREREPHQQRERLYEARRIELRKLIEWEEAT